MLGWLVDEKQIEPHAPVFDKSERDDGTFSRSDFQWNEVVCCIHRLNPTHYSVSLRGMLSHPVQERMDVDVPCLPNKGFRRLSARLTTKRFNCNHGQGNHTKEDSGKEGKRRPQLIPQQASQCARGQHHQSTEQIKEPECGTA